MLESRDGEYGPDAIDLLLHYRWMRAATCKDVCRFEIEILSQHLGYLVG